MRTTVYRVEDRDGAGPYRGDKSYLGEHSAALRKMANQHADLSEHPTPSNDIPGAPFGLFWDWDEFLCAFANVPDLIRWFSGWIAMLHQAGFLVASYEVDTRDIRHGSRQVMFRDGKRTKQSSLIEAVMAG